jgi:hypothetical protein
MSLLENVSENFSALETSVLKLSAQMATKLLQLEPCKTTVVIALKEHGPVARIQFFNLFLSQCMMKKLIHGYFFPP